MYWIHKETLSCDGDDTYAQVSDAPEGEFFQVSTGSYHACVLQQNNEIDCWGKNTSGQTDSPSGGTFLQVSTGEEHSCALDNEGENLLLGDIPMALLLEHIHKYPLVLIILCSRFGWSIGLLGRQ